MPGNANSANPHAATTGPATSGRRAPKRSTSPPAQRDSATNSGDERQQRGARRGRRIALHLDQVERKEEQPAAERGIQQQRQQVGAP